MRGIHNRTESGCTVSSTLFAVGQQALMILLMFSLFLGFVHFLCGHLLFCYFFFFVSGQLSCQSTQQISTQLSCLCFFYVTFGHFYTHHFDCAVPEIEVFCGCLCISKRDKNWVMIIGVGGLPLWFLLFSFWLLPVLTVFRKADRLRAIVRSVGCRAHY